MHMLLLQVHTLLLLCCLMSHATAPCIHIMQARASSCQRTFSTAAALTAACSDATSPLSPTYWTGMGSKLSVERC